MAALDEALGLLFLTVYIVGIVSLAAGITWAVIRIFPTERNPKGADEDATAKPAKPEATPANGGSESGGGSLFRRAKRGKKS
jgi:hypothetical protein